MTEEKESFLKFVNKFFPEQLQNQWHKKLIERMSEEINKSGKRTAIIYCGRPRTTKALLNKYIAHINKNRKNS